MYNMNQSKEILITETGHSGDNNPEVVSTPETAQDKGTEVIKPATTPGETADINTSVESTPSNAGQTVEQLQSSVPVNNSETVPVVAVGQEMLETITNLNTFDANTVTQKLEKLS